MRVVKTRGMTGAYPVYNNMPTVNLPSAEVLGFRTGLEQDRPFYYSDDTHYWESQRPAELQRARESYMSGFPAGVQDPATDPRMNNAIEPVYPMNWVSPAGDVEAIASSLGMLSEGDYLGAGIGGGLALAGVFLPGSFQTKSTMADGVLERSLDSKGMIHPNAVRAIIDSKNTGETEKYLLSSALENVTVDPATGRVNYNELKQKVDELVPRMRAEESGEYADYGLDNVFEENYLLPGVEKPKSEMVGLFPEQEGIYPVHDGHLDEPGYGHYRSAVLPQDPETAYITEIQSDAATSERARNMVLDDPKIDEVGRHMIIMNRPVHPTISAINNTTGSNLSAWDDIQTRLYDFDYDQMMETILKSENPTEALESYPMVKPDELVRVLDNSRSSMSLKIEDERLNSFVDEGLNGLKEFIAEFQTNGNLMSKDDLVDLVLSDKFENAQTKISRNRLMLQNEIEAMLSSHFYKIMEGVPLEASPLKSERIKKSWINSFFYSRNTLDNPFLADKPDLKQALKTFDESNKAYYLLDNLKTTINRANAGYSQTSEHFFSHLEYDINNGLDYDTWQELKNYTPNPITKSSIKNYTERILQEAVDDVVSKNPQAKRIRIPVGNTAAKIQGHNSVTGSTAKYDKMNKTIKRVIGVKPNKVSGPGGFEYWEFDLPEGGFEKQVFKFGGKIKPIKKRKGKFGIIKQ